MSAKFSHVLSLFTIVTLLCSESLQAQAPAPWSETDVGNTGAAGSTAYNNDFFSIYAAGADIWGNSDAFRFVYQPVSGDFEFTAVINWVAYTDGWAKAGLMVRQSLDPGAVNALAFVTPVNGLGFQWRSAAGGNSQWQPGGAGTAPVYVRLVRRGDTLTAYRSTQGSTGRCLEGRL